MEDVEDQQGPRRQTEMIVRVRSASPNQECGAAAPRWWQLVSLANVDVVNRCVDAGEPVLGVADGLLIAQVLLTGGVHGEDDEQSVSDGLVRGGVSPADGLSRPRLLRSSRSPHETLANLSLTGHLRCFSDQPGSKIIQAVGASEMGST